MTDLLPLVAAPGAHTMIYTDPAFPASAAAAAQRAPAPLYEHTPVLIVHHGVARNGRDYRDYWLRVVDDAGILAIAIEFTEQAFPDYLWYHFGNRHDENGTPNPREQWTYGIDERLFDALREQGLTRQRKIRVVRPLRRAGSSCTGCCRSAIGIASRWPSVPMPALTPCPTWNCLAVRSGRGRARS